KRAGTLIAVPHHGRLTAHGTDDDLAARAMIQPIARGADDRQDGLTVEGQPVRGNVDVVLGRQSFHGRGVLLQPRLKPALAQDMHLRHHPPVLLLSQRSPPGDPLGGRPPTAEVQPLTYGGGTLPPGSSLTRTSPPLPSRLSRKRTTPSCAQSAAPT